MKLKLFGIATALAFAASAPVALAQHKMIMPQDLKWADTPSLPPGAQAAVLEGPMNEAVPFTVRLKFHANYKVPHWHPAIEHVTVLSGAFHMGLGEKFDPKALHKLGVGAMMIMEPKTPHFAMTKEPTIIQIHGMGPWAVNYVNPDDDPRKKADAKKAEPKKDEPKKDEKKK